MTPQQQARYTYLTTQRYARALTPGEQAELDALTSGGGGESWTDWLRGQVEAARQSVFGASEDLGQAAADQAKANLTIAGGVALENVIRGLAVGTATIVVAGGITYFVVYSGIPQYTAKLLKKAV